MAVFSSLPARCITRISFFLSDFRDVLSFRTCSKRVLEAVGEDLKDSLTRIVGMHVPNPKDLVAYMESRGESYVAGGASILFFLRNIHFRTTVLELYVSRSSFHPYLDHLTRVQKGEMVAYRHVDNYNGAAVAARGLREAAFLRMTIGKHVPVVALCCADSLDPLSAIATAWGSAVINYISPTHFGAAYPYLLIRHRNIVGHSPLEANLVPQYEDRGIQSRLSLHYWEDGGKHGCGAKVFACSAQIRSYDDEGALRGRMQPLRTAPLTSTVEWRLDNRPCPGSCL
ncbi:hypothetical protein C8Q76DRAFT_803669 [Earliella scabrosa]|nr:hypothetical protein C8Q76DRAFT_803669 [Earliella scabrosa]